MSPRYKKLIGLVVLVLGMIVYALVAIRLAGDLSPMHPALELAYYVAAGLIWALPTIPLIIWMNRP